MQTVILCGGLGTRLKEETEFRPKPMVPIGGKPILWHIMKIYSHFGHKDFVLPLGYKGEQIRDFFCNYQRTSQDIRVHLGKKKIECLGNEQKEGWSVILADTGQVARKSERLLTIRDYLKGKDVMITYGDGVSDIDINKLLAFHKSHGKVATISGVTPSAQFGELKFEGDRITQFKEKQVISPHYISGGFMVVKRKLFFDYVYDDAELEESTFEDLVDDEQLMIYKHPGGWACMDTQRDMEYLNNLWHNGEAFWKVWK